MKQIGSFWETDTQTERHTDGKNTQTHTHIDAETDRHTDRPTDGKIHRRIVTFSIIAPYKYSYLLT